MYMAQRGQESPMDFQWEGGSGPRDPNSPFKMSSLQGSLSPDPAARNRPSIFHPTPSNNHPSFSGNPTVAPSSPIPATPSIFATPKSRMPQAPPFRTPSFTTPRHSYDTPSKDSDLFSSPADSPADFDAQTPESLARRPRSNSRPPALTPLSVTRVSGRGELRKGKFHDGAITKSRLRRNGKPSDRDFWTSGTAQSGDDEAENSDDDNSDNESPTFSRVPPPLRAAKSAAEKWAKTHQDIPLIMANYLQLFFNVSLVMLLLYALFCFYLTIRRDVDQKVAEYSAEIIQESNLCAREYIDNRCALHMRVPAMELRCSAWEKCMNRDAAQIGRARVSAETFAEIINGFVEPISYKTMFFFILLIFSGFLASNMAFTLFRSKHLKPPSPSFLSSAVAAAPLATSNTWEPHQTIGWATPSGTPLRAPTTPIRSTPAGGGGFGYGLKTPSRNNGGGGLGWDSARKGMMGNGGGGYGYDSPRKNGGGGGVMAGYGSPMKNNGNANGEQDEERKALGWR